MLRSFICLIILILILCFHVFSFQNNVFQVTPDCSYELKLKNMSTVCIFNKAIKKSQTENEERRSIFSINELDTSPNSQGWSRCTYCSWKNGHFLFNNIEIPTRISLSWSLWGEFFHHDEADRVSARIRTSDKNSEEIFRCSRPVFYLPMITFHVGHILIDLIEEVYFSMISAYGEVRRDALIVIDVAHPEERAILQQKIDIHIYDDNYDLFGQVLLLLTDVPIISIVTFESMMFNLGSEHSEFIFADLHLGLNISESFFNLGHEHSPCIFNGADFRGVDNRTSSSGSKLEPNDLLALQQRYKQFQKFVWDIYNFTKYGIASHEVLHSLKATDAAEKVTYEHNILFVQRSSDRAVTNMQDLIDTTVQFNLSSITLDLSSTLFSEQLRYFQSIDILIAAAGTAVHNMVFMRPGSAVILLMQPGWCPWSWIYANQAVLLDIHIFILCSDNTLNYSTFHATRHFWIQGPRATKREDITVSVVGFQELLKLAVEVTLPDNFGSVQQQTAMKIAEGRVMASRVDRPLCGFDLDVIGETNNEMRSTYNLNEVTAPVDMFSGDGIMIGNESGRGLGALSQPVPRSVLSSYVTSLKFADTQGTDEAQGWKFALLCELALEEYPIAAAGAAAEVFSSFPHLSLCLKSVFTESSLEPSCFELNQQLNYYTDLWMTVTKPVQWFQVWIQMSNEGGKFVGSDAFAALDMRLPQGGLGLWKFAIGKSIILDIPLLVTSQAVESSVNESGHPPSDRESRMIEISLLLQGNFSTRLDLQRLVQRFCSSHGLAGYLCCEVTANVYSHLHKRRALLSQGYPDVQYMPTRERPFVFLHIDKTAGTTLREFIVESADRHGLSHFVPCHGGIHCVTVTLEDPIARSLVDISKVSVLAGHFFWGEWLSLPHYRDIHSASSRLTISLDGSDFLPPVFVMGRHPITRAISYYYQRCYDSEGCLAYKRMLNEVSVKELETFVLSSRNANYRADNTTLMITDEGLEDAACRTLANERGTAGLVVSSRAQPVTIPPPLSAAAASRALRNIDSCVVGLLERWTDTKRVMKFWFPWMGLGRDRKKMSLYVGKETIESLRPELREVIERYNQCDLQLYEKMLQRFTKQLEIIDSKLFFG